MTNDRVRVDRHQQALKRRKLYLEAQLATGSHSDGAGDWVRAEVAALAWALAALEDADAIGLHRLGRLSHAERNRIREALAGAAVPS